MHLLLNFLPQSFPGLLAVLSFWYVKMYEYHLENQVCKGCRILHLYFAQSSSCVYESDESDFVDEDEIGPAHSTEVRLNALKIENGLKFRWKRVCKNFLAKYLGKNLVNSSYKNIRLNWNKMFLILWNFSCLYIHKYLICTRFRHTKCKVSSKLAWDRRRGKIDNINWHLVKICQFFFTSFAEFEE